MRFRDRVEAGHLLARAVERRLEGQDVVVLGLPRGGVPVAAEVAEALQAPLDVIIVRKLGAPFQPELGLGAIGEDGARVVNDDVVRLARVTDAELAAVEGRERAELDRRVRRYRGDRPRARLAGRTAVIVDDGIATGSTVRAACLVARAQGAGRIVLAVPVAPPDALTELEAVADEMVCLQAPEQLRSIGEWYVDFSQTPDEQVVALLARAAARSSAQAVGDPGRTGPRQTRPPPPG